MTRTYFSARSERPPLVCAAVKIFLLLLAGRQFSRLQCSERIELNFPCILPHKTRPHGRYFRRCSSGSGGVNEPSQTANRGAPSQPATKKPSSTPDASTDSIKTRHCAIRAGCSRGVKQAPLGRPHSTHR